MRRFVLGVSFILCVSLGTVFAQEPQPQPDPQQPQQAPAKKENPQKPDKSAEKAMAKARAGEVLSIDATKNEIVIKDENDAELHLLISSATKITRDGKSLAIGDVKVGDKLLIDCEDSAGGCKAKSIQVAVPPQPE